ncbi:MFS transporter [Exiguobacterium sp. FSL W8-0210]|uniref:MFS transporter n=1 Tax=Exiguobacterium sp. FSL W8-0210 TaxID=2921598 RepID=UPI0030F64346
MALAEKTTTLEPETVLTESKHGLFHQPVAVWAVFFASITAFMGMGLVNPVLPTIAENLEASKSEVTLLFTSYNAVMAFAMLITGAISSRIGQKGTLMLGIAVIATVAGFASQADSIWTLITTAVMDAAPVERSTASAAYSFLRFLGAAIAPFMAGKLAEIFNANLPFYVGSGFVLLSVIIIGVNLKHIRHIDRTEGGH